MGRNQKIKMNFTSQTNPKDKKSVYFAGHDSNEIVELEVDDVQIYHCTTPESAVKKYKRFMSYWQEYNQFKLLSHNLPK
jgi:hypothetical protein